MSSSPTAATSTTRSSINSSSRSKARSAATVAVAATPTPIVAATPTPPVAVIACGALGPHVREITARRGWRVEVHTLPSLLHNHPERIAPAAEGLGRELQARGPRVALGYADWGSY